MNMLGMFSVTFIGAIVWGFVMPDVLSSLVVGLVWGAAVGHFWARNLPRKGTWS